MKTLLYYTVLISAIVPALILLLLTLEVLPHMLMGFEFGVIDFIVTLSCLLGICGFAGLISLVFKRMKRNYVPTILLLASGIIGMSALLIVEGGQTAWQWLISFDEPGEWFILMWPNIVAMAFAIMLTVKHARRRSAIEHQLR